MTVYDFERKPVKTRKKHWCRYCGEVIPAGADGAERESGFDEDGPFRRYACARCAPYLNEFWRWCDYCCENITDWFYWFMDECHPGWRERANKRAMISQPMAGKTDEEIAEARDKACAKLREMGFEVSDTVFDFADEQLNALGVKNAALYYLANSIQAMSRCDCMYFVKGWEIARGCRIEHDAAIAYGLEVLYED